MARGWALLSSKFILFQTQLLPVKSSILKTPTSALEVVDLLTRTGIIIVCASDV